MTPLYQKVHDRIVELVPEIMELKKGCKFIDHDSTQTLEYLFEEKSGAVCAFSLTLGNDFYSDDFRFEDHTKVTIIGREINLEDVLRAMKKSEERIVANIEAMDSNILLGTRDLTLSEFVPYNLTLPFSSQQPEVYELLAKVLKV